MAVGMDQGGRVRIGTSGWHYRHWRGPFYPEDMDSRAWLGYYSQRFDTVEINATFYRLPTAHAVEEWRAAVPDSFVFAPKASRYITHVKRLDNPEQPARRFVDRVAGLREKLGPVLFQTPLGWRRNEERLERLLHTLPKTCRYAFEFRDGSWFHDSVYAILERHGAGFCIHDFGDVRSPMIATSGWVYVRLHGPGTPYQNAYDAEALGAWAGAIAEWARDGKDVFCFFNNDAFGHAVHDALRLREILDSQAIRT